jgi:ubiquinone/menaquinone biosynthesis C-methylase UbiE
MDRSGDTPELLDGVLARSVLAGNLRDLARINRLLGGAELSWQAVRAVADMTPNPDASGAEPSTARPLGPGGPLTLLDVGTGGADIPRHLLRRARRAAMGLSITATDVRPEILELARVMGAPDADLHIEQAPPDRIDAPAGSHDIVHISLVLHHLEPSAAVNLLGEMARVARRAVIVNDLDRARRWWALAWLMTRLTTRNRYTRHDAPLSVRRAYTPDEAVAMAAEAGLSEAARVRDRIGHRFALVLVSA